jgi:hypothetical protein
MDDITQQTATYFDLIFEVLKVCLAAILGFVFGIFGPLIHNRLNRRRKNRQNLRTLYKEILFLQEEAARLARFIAASEMYTNKIIDQNFIRDYAISDPIVFDSSTIGEVEEYVNINIIPFYLRCREANRGLPMIMHPQPGEDRIRYMAGTVLRPAVEAIDEIQPSLRKIEITLGLPITGRPNTGDAEDIIEIEDIRLKDPK